MKPLPKITGPDVHSAEEFSHPDLWERQVYPSWGRLAVGARQNEVPLILQLCRDLEGPFGILYVLLVSRRGRQSARYQSVKPVGYDGLEDFLSTFQQFLEQDGRHHLWVMSLAGDGQIVYDNHNLLYLYGDLDGHELRLANSGFTRGTVRVPAPHMHHYHPSFDTAEDELMTYWPWKEFPLEEQDDP